MNRTIALVAAAALVSAAGPSWAIDLADPTPLAAAFRNFCLSDFPKIDVIAAKATAAGWVERKVTITSGALPRGMSPTNLPRFFEWRGLSLVLMGAGDGMERSCQLSTTGTHDVTVARMAAALRPDAPRLEQKHGEESAVWTQGQTETRASVGGRVRNIIYIIRIPSEQTRK